MKKVIHFVLFLSIVSSLGSVGYSQQFITFGTSVDAIRSSFDSVNISSKGNERNLHIDRAPLYGTIGQYDCLVDTQNQIIAYIWTARNYTFSPSKFNMVVTDVVKILGAPSDITVDNMYWVRTLIWDQAYKKNEATYLLECRNGAMRFILNKSLMDKQRRKR